MKKDFLSLTTIKDQINDLIGCPIKLEVNTGRKKIINLVGTINRAYPSVFSFEYDDFGNRKIKTYSYSDVLCGDVKILKAN